MKSIEISEYHLNMLNEYARGKKLDSFTALGKLIEKHCKVTKKRTKAQPSDFYIEMKGIYTGWYKLEYGRAYMWKGIDDKALGGIIKQLKELVTDKIGEAPAEEVKRAFGYVLTNLPEWYYQNGSSMSVINSKLNDIVTQIKNGKSTSESLTKGLADKIIERRNSGFQGDNYDRASH